MIFMLLISVGAIISVIGAYKNNKLLLWLGGYCMGTGLYMLNDKAL